MQRDIANRNNVVMDGRDIGTVVLPEADIKIFLTASAEARAKRRLLELQAKGIESDFESVLEDMKYRDAQDSSRAAAPLKPAEDAVIVDTTDLDFEASFEVLFELITGVIKENS
jgi:cytidylate kinase